MEEEMRQLRMRLDAMETTREENQTLVMAAQDRLIKSVSKIGARV
jgi:hypothetical protein